MTLCGFTAGGSGTVSTAATAKTAPRIQRRYGLVFMPDTDTHDNGFPAFAICKFVKKGFSPSSENQ